MWESTILMGVKWEFVHIHKIFVVSYFNFGQLLNDISGEQCRTPVQQALCFCCYHRVASILHHFNEKGWSYIILECLFLYQYQ